MTVTFAQANVIGIEEGLGKCLEEGAAFGVGDVGEILANVNVGD